VNAKPTALAAAVVIAAGLATGVAIGGKTETKTRTVTMAASEATSAGATSPEPPASADPEPTPGFQRVDLDEELVTIDDTTTAPGDDYVVTLIEARYGVPAQLQQGPEKDQALTFDFDSSIGFDESAAEHYQFEITVPEGATKFVSEMGFLKGEVSDNRVKVAFYMNRYEDAQQLKQRELESASETAPVDLVVRGASKIIVRLTCTNKGRIWKTPSDDDPSFGFLDAHFE